MFDFIANESAARIGELFFVTATMVAAPFVIAFSFGLY